MDTISNTTVEALLSTSRFISNLESNRLRIPRRLRIFTDAEAPELQLFQVAYLAALLAYAFVLNPLTELLFPFPGGRARARRVCLFVPLLAWGSLVLSWLPIRLTGEEPADIARYLYVRIARAQGRSPAEVVCEDL